MVKQYPDHITIELEQGKPYQENGVWKKPAPSTFESHCRAEPNKANAVLKTADGALIYFDFNVYMPKTLTQIAVGSRFTLAKHDGMITEGTVKRTHNGQLNSRIWV